MQGICDFRKFLFWLQYDGSRFSSMAKGAASHKGPSVYKLFECCLARLFDEENSKILTTTVSRTDAKVHALRNPILIKTPNERTASLIQSYDYRTKFICDFNDLIEKVGFKDAMELVEINPVEKGFNRNFHISYRRYVYRIRRFHSMDAFLKSRENDKQSLVDLSEFNYSWSHPPSFCVEKADEMCAILRRPELNYASFYNHKSRERLDGKNYKTTTGRRQPKLLRIYRGEPYALPDKDSEYFNIEIVAHSFLRQQIRRMVALICRAAYNMDYAKYTAEFLLRDPDPSKFHQVGLKPAPPNGLFLVDVVYDPRMFLSPVPYYSNPWDDEDMNEDINLNNEGEEEEDSDDYDEIKEERKLRVLVN